MESKNTNRENKNAYPITTQCKQLNSTFFPLFLYSYLEFLI